MTNDEKYHSGDCENAHTDRCRCWCGGEFHGIRSGVYAKIEGKIIEPTIAGERIMTLDDGGMVTNELMTHAGEQFTCVGPCNKPLSTDVIWGYPDHSGGFADKDGRKWWLYVKCPLCNYATSLWKIKNHLIQEVTA